MEFLAALWLPILVSAIAVFVLSSLLHMVIPFHKNDAKKLPGEDSILDAMRTAGVGPGNYFFPACEDMKQMSTPEMMEKYNRGPMGHMTVAPLGPPAIARSLVHWFFYSLLISVMVAYIGHLGIASGEGALRVFRVTASIAVLPYAIGAISDSIWKAVPWSVTLRFIIDGLIYGFGTGAVFALFWPGA